jgi:hypothetical protein
VLQIVTVLAIGGDPPYMNHFKNLHCYNEFIISANILWANFNVINNPSMFFMCASLMFSNCLKMIKIDRNMSEF